jgi:regulatory protein
VNNKKTDSLQKAKNCAFILLKFRPRSEKEIAKRLKKKKFDNQVISEVVFFCKEKGFINDKEFAKAWVESRLKRPLGINRIKLELKSKGISEEIITGVLSEAKAQFDEGRIVGEIARQRFMKLKGMESFKAKRRIYAYLLRRGFSLETVTDAIEQL